MNIVYLGTPKFAVLPLKKLASSKHKVIAVVTQADKPVGRGYKVINTPVKEEALKQGIQVYQFISLRKEGVEILKSLKPDIMVTAAYGQILTKEILDIAPYGVINIHGSLLPKYRGPAPIQWAIIKGEIKTGITIMQTAVGLDTGDMILKKEIDINSDDTAQSLSEKMSIIGADILIEALEQISNNTAIYTPQDESLSSYFPKLTKELGKIDWSKSANEIEYLIRGLNPWPGTFTTLWDKKYKIWNAKIADREFPLKAGTIARTDNRITVMCGKGALDIIEIQQDGGKRMNTSEYLRGHKNYIGEKFL